MAELAPAEQAQAVADAKRAQRLYEPDLRRLGAIGTMGFGIDPEQPTWRQWWARCLVRGGGELPVPLLAEGFATCDEAGAALVELAARPRLDG